MAINIYDFPMGEQILPSSVPINHLNNPRGLAFNQQGDLMLIEAGGDETAIQHSGRLTIRDANSLALKSQWLSGFKACNFQARMHRDEIMGLSDLAPTESNTWLVTYTDYAQGSKIFELSEAGANPLFFSHGNINSICYNPHSQSWFCVKPGSDEVVEFSRNRAERTLCKIPKLHQGVDAVPVTIIYQNSTQKLLVTLFSGELKQNPKLKGVEFNKRQGQIIAIDPTNGEVETLVRGLTLPTALCLDSNDNILVTELCSEFLQPLPPAGPIRQALHGGFKRFSGRLLKIEKDSGQTQVLATELDTPSNIAIYGNRLYISEGMGLPGRPIPTPKGVRTLQGFIRQLDAQALQTNVQSQRPEMAVCSG